MRTPPHELTVNKSTWTPDPLRTYGLDIETLIYPDENPYRLGCVASVAPVGGVVTRSYFDKMEQCMAIDEAATRGRRIRVVGHGVSFDLKGLNFYKNMQALGYELTKHYDSFDRFIAVFEKPRAHIKVIDTMNFSGHKKLDKLAGSVGLEKIHFGENEEDELEKWNDIPVEDLERRCRVDAEISLRYYLKWVRIAREFDLGRFADTLSGLAFNAYRHRFMAPHKIMVHGNSKPWNAAATALAMAASRGPRVQVFRRGPVEDCYYLDFNSLYADRMRKCKMPIRLLHYYGMGATDRSEILRDSLKGGLMAFAECKLDVPKGQEMFAKRRGDRLIFPNGKFAVPLAPPEVVRALAEGLITDVGRFATYEGEVIFDKYIDFTDGKRTSCPADEEEWKGMGRELFGRFGMRMRETDRAPEFDGQMEWGTSDLIEDGKAPRSIRFLNGKAFVAGSKEPAYNALPEISGTVLAEARLMLFDVMGLLGEDKYYVDTDAIITSNPWPVAHLIDSTKLGFLKAEKFGDFNLRAPKDYGFDGLNLKTGKCERDRTLKGVPKWAREVSPGVFVFSHILRTTESLKRGIPLTKILVEERTKTIKRSVRTRSTPTMNDPRWLDL